MSVRLEWTEAQYARVAVKARGDVLGDGQRVTKQAALVIGPLVIEGDRVSLEQLLRAGVEQIVSAELDALIGPRRGPGGGVGSAS